MDIRHFVGKNLTRIRKEQGFSQEELAFRCDLHRTYISGIERGVRNPTIMALDKIAKQLKIKVKELF